MNKRREYMLAFIGLSAVLIALASLLLVNNDLAITASLIAVISVVLSIYYIYLEEGEIVKQQKIIIREFERRVQIARKDAGFRKARYAKAQNGRKNDTKSK